MYYFIYETTNLINGKKYRGRHKTNLINDGYIGSGTQLMSAISKYGINNFERQIIFHAFNFKNLVWAEKVFVDKIWVERRDTYNITLGGGGSYTKHVNGEWVNIMQLEKVKEKRRNTLYLNGTISQNAFTTENNPMNSQEIRTKMVNTRKSHPLGYHYGKQPFYITEEQKQNIRKRMTENNPMKTDEAKQQKRNTTARKYGFSDDQHLINYIYNLYHTMAMNPAMIREVIGCDKSTVERRLIWVHQ